MVKIGRHIVVYGPTCSGKSTVASHIAQSIEVPHIELDAIFWTPQWGSRPQEEFRAEVSTLLSRCVDGWVCDGNYRRVRDLILPLADTVVWLRPPFRVIFRWALKRTISRCWKGELLWGMNRESWRQQFLSRDSLLLYVITHWRHQQEHTGRALEEIPHHASIIQLHSSQEIDVFLAGLSPTTK